MSYVSFAFLQLSLSECFIVIAIGYVGDTYCVGCPAAAL